MPFDARRPRPAPAGRGKENDMKIVDADSVQDYLGRYYKPSKRTDTLLTSYQAEFAKDGYICTSHHDNVTGHFICWPKMPEWAKGE